MEGEIPQPQPVGQHLAVDGLGAGADGVDLVGGDGHPDAAVLRQSREAEFLPEPAQLRVHPAVLIRDKIVRHKQLAGGIAILSQGNGALRSCGIADGLQAGIRQVNGRVKPAQHPGQVAPPQGRGQLQPGG